MKNVLLATTASLALVALAACSQEETTEPTPAPDEQSQVEPAPQDTQDNTSATDVPPVVEDVAETVGNALQPVTQAAREVSQDVSQGLAEAVEPVGELAAQIADGAENAVADAAVAISDTINQQGENAGAVGGAVMEMVGEAATQVAALTATDDPLTATDDPLTANSWGFAGTDAVTVSFSDGSVSGNAGCNAFTGSYSDEGSGSIVIGPLVSTKMMCEDAIMMIEREVLAGIGAAISYTINEQSLILTDSSGNALTLEAQFVN